MICEILGTGLLVFGASGLAFILGLRLGFKLGEKMSQEKRNRGRFATLRKPKNLC